MAKKEIPNNKKIEAGSAGQSDEPAFLIIGRIQKPHGVRGEVRVVPHTDLPERFTWLETVWIGEDDPQPFDVEAARFHGELILLKLAGYDSREAAQDLRGEWLQVPESEAIPLEEGEYYLYQLEGLQVFTDEGEELGELVQVMETGANNVFVVRGESGELLLPDTDEVVQAIDFENGRMTVHLLAGLRP
ncbi:MAG: 16S rRNA processing protein RimM [Ardenticatenaceae bacterium]|nr:16S rRNA processing protein RimM [Ardenticatenaceae bacterium]